MRKTCEFGCRTSHSCDLPAVDYETNEDGSRTYLCAEHLDLIESMKTGED